MLPDLPIGFEDDSRSAGAPVNEIEVTPEMIEAGVEVLLNYNQDFSNEKDIVAEIFKVMLSVSASHH